LLYLCGVKFKNLYKMVYFLLVIALVFWYTIRVYNTVKPLDIYVSESESNIRVVLEKRNSILDKLNEIVNSYSAYEKDIIERLSQDMRANTNSMFAINRLYDAYPDLKLNDTFSLQVEKLYDVESERQYMIEYCNKSIKKYNEAVTAFPEILVCSAISFKEKQFFI